MCTSQYFAFKTDAMNVDLDLPESLTQNAFIQKWQDHYDLDQSGQNTGFLISAQDWTKIKVKQTDITVSGPEYIVVKTTIEDTSMNFKETIWVKIKPTNGAFKIQDVIQK